MYDCKWHLPDKSPVITYRDLYNTFQLLDWVSTALLTGLIDPSTANAESGTRFNVCEVINKLINDDIARIETEDNEKGTGGSQQRVAQNKQHPGSFHLTRIETTQMANEYSRIMKSDVHRSDLDPCIDMRTTPKACDSYVVFRKDKQHINLCDPIKHEELELAKVEFFFDHEFEDKTYTWACLDTFDKVKVKKGFLVANTESSERKLLLKGLLSKALITAKYKYKVYFINLNLV